MKFRKQNFTPHLGARGGITTVGGGGGNVTSYSGDAGSEGISADPNPGTFTDPDWVHTSDPTW